MASVTRLPPFLIATVMMIVQPPTGTAEQPRPVRPPATGGESYAIGGDLSRYAALYGTPEFRGIDDDAARPWPSLHAIRTIGTLAEVPGRGRGGGAFASRPVDFLNSRTVLMLCGDRHCAAITPALEMLEFFNQIAPSWLLKKVEIIGARDLVPQPDPFNPEYGFVVWSVSLWEEGPDARRAAKGSTLESLVRSPGAAPGRPVTVRGVFRGANLFQDLPAETRRRPSDWVLRDGAFSVWVTGKEPRGHGWSLDPRAKSDCRFRLEVSGRAELAGGYVYLRARSVSLLGPAREEEPATPP